MKEPACQKNDRGAVALMVAGGIVALLGIAALVVDLGNGLATKVQLQNAADSGAMAGTRELAQIYKPQVALGNFDYTQDTLSSSEQAQIASRVNEFASQNIAGGVPITIGLEDVVVGVWDGSAQTFTPGATGVNAVKVKARRDDQSNGSLATTLATVLGVENMAVRADTSVNLLSSVNSMPPGKGDVPFAISKAWFTNRDSPCGPNATIKFYPTGSTDGCAGWHVFTETPANASTLKTIIGGLNAGSYTTPETIGGETSYNFTGGTVASAFPEFVELFNEKKGADGTWKVHVPVYARDNCSNPSGLIKIIGFATARITNVTSSPQKSIDAQVECDIVDWGESDGPTNFGTSVQATRLID